jgi:hypothetical protein
VSPCKFNPCLSPNRQASKGVKDVVEMDDNRKIKLITSIDNQEFQEVFKDDPIITVPIIEEVKKPEPTEEDLFKEKIREMNLEEAVEDQMLGGDFALKAVLNNLPVKAKSSKFQEKRNSLEEFF